MAFLVAHKETMMVMDDVAYTITANPLLFNDVTLVKLDTGDAEAKGVTVEDFMK